jgi:hypothetical protein
MAFTKVTDNLLSSGVGTGAGNILELDSSGKLPAVDGSLLTNLPAGGVDGIVSTANATAITIDSNENVLVGKTVAGFANTGHQLNGGGSYAAFTRDGGTPVLINRKTDNGTIVELMKDGTIVGSIGTDSSNDFVIDGSANHSGLRFKDSVVVPKQNGSDADNAIDLGKSDKRWKDLYLSGGLRVGGTATANSLDDYEEGTWTGTISDGSNNMTMAATKIGNYIKVGQLVTVHGYFVSSAFGSVASGSPIRLTGLPFTNGALYTGGATGHGGGHSITAGHSVAYHSPPNTSYITLIVWDGAGGTSAMTAGEWGSGGNMIFSLSYRTS